MMADPWYMFGWGRAAYTVLFILGGVAVLGGGFAAGKRLRIFIKKSLMNKEN